MTESIIHGDPHIALAAYGPAAKRAAPKLLSVYTNVIVGPDKGFLSGSILEALRKFDPESAGKAEAFLVNTGPLNAARIGYSTNLLNNGKELIAGGFY